MQQKMVRSTIEGQFMLAEDKRRWPRQRVLKEGKIVTLGNWSVIDCQVRDVSATGARICCQDQVAVPNEFRLLMPFDGNIRGARVVWRRGDQLGLRFTGEWRKAPPRKW